MSGTSLDGLDIAFCELAPANGQWNYKVKKATTITYPDDLVESLQCATKMSGLELKQLDIVLGNFFADQIGNFVKQHRLTPQVISSHGHTIFHQPELSLTQQIGDPSIIHAKTGLPVIADFRSLDVAKGGDGAPLVPIGDQLLFGEYDACLNLGGIANISYRDKSGLRKAFDIVPVNMALNHLANRSGQSFDTDGAIAKSGQPIKELIAQWSSLDFHSKAPPKSLGFEWFEKFILPGLTGHSTSDLMHSYALYASTQIANAIKEYMGNGPFKIMVTGGGAYNDFFMHCLRDQASDNQWVIPESAIVEYKEALVFALLGVLRIRNEANILSSATGASNDSIAGIVLGHPSNIG